METRNAVLIFVGFVSGMLITGFVFFVFFHALAPTLPSAEVVTSSANLIRTAPQKAPSTPDNVQTNILLPMTLVSNEYYETINRIVNTLNQIATNNNETILPPMNEIKQKSQSGDWEGVFDLATLAKIAIQKNKEFATATRNDLYALRSINEKTTSDSSFREQTVAFIDAGDKYADAFMLYLETLEKFLTGKSPTSELIDDLNGKISFLSVANKNFQQEMDNLLSVAKERSSLPTK